MIPLGYVVKNGSHPYAFPRSDFAVTLVASSPESAITDLSANSGLGVIILSHAEKKCFMDPMFDSVNSITCFSKNLLKKESFQSIQIHQNFISY